MPEKAASPLEIHLPAGLRPDSAPGYSLNSCLRVQAGRRRADLPQIKSNANRPDTQSPFASNPEAGPIRRGLLVGVADLAATDRPHETITTFALGSCLGITCYDRINRVGGMLHAMLPDSSQRHRSELIPAMYLDTGVRALLDRVLGLGGDPRHSDFKVFGGACVGGGTDYFNIGKRNIEQMAALAHALDLKIDYWHVGGGINRTITLFLDNGEVLLRMPGRREITL